MNFKSFIIILNILFSLLSKIQIHAVKPEDSLNEKLQDTCLKPVSSFLNPKNHINQDQLNEGLPPYETALDQKIMRLFDRIFTEDLNPENDKLKKKIMAMIKSSEGINLNQKIARHFDTVIEEKLNSENDKLKKEIMAIIESSQTKSDPSNSISYIYKIIIKNNSLSDHYNAFFKTIFIDTPLLSHNENWTIVQYLALVHESYHAILDHKMRYLLYLTIIDRVLGTFMILPKFIYPTIRYFDEKQAIGAQHDLVSRIPLKYRQDLLEAIKFIRISILSQNQETKSLASKLHEKLFLDNLDQVTEYSLRYADLSKKEFIKKMQPIHSYTFKDIFLDSNKLTRIKKLMILLGIVQTLEYIYYENQNENSMGFIPLDLYLFLKFYGDNLPKKEFLKNQIRDFYKYYSWIDSPDDKRKLQSRLQ